MSLPEGLLFGMGNPLLDIQATVDPSILQKYNMKANDAILAEASHIPLYDEMEEKYQVIYTAGGATQNALRVVQWILGQPNVTTFMGGVGDDVHGKTIAKNAIADGVNVQYQIVKEQPTGSCAVCVTGQDRSLCANLGAANHFTKDHLDKPENYAYVEKAKFYYISGFFLTVSPESILKVAKHALANDRVFSMNLSAPFVAQFYADKLQTLFPYIDILFGNESEARTFSTSLNLGTDDVAEIAQKLAALPKENQNRSRLIVFTQGCDPVILCQDGKISTFPITKIPLEQIKDTNGAGDAFVGGFLAQYIQGQPLPACVKCGVWAATEIIQQSGVVLPKGKSYVA